MARLDNQRKRLLYRSAHRGMKEMDALLGGYANERLDFMSDSELLEFESLMDESDNDLMNWILEREQIPDNRNSVILRKIIDYKKTY
ncbi:MAG: succinate dehydrogenase assembly factor 2 [Rhodospirillales bacterium]|nr:succinate dehydrogenase assembly factor 2 [Rhodospirillales bacterium]